MRKLALFILLFSMTIGLFAEEIKVRYNFSTPTIEANGDYSILKLDNCRNISIAGDPIIPWHAVSILLPQGEEAVNIRIEKSNPILLSTSKQLFPGQHVQPISEGGSGIFVKNETSYNSSEPFPKNDLGTFSTQFMNGFAFCISTFSPVSYSPLTGEITVYQDVTIIVETKEIENSKKQSAMLSTRENIHAQVKRTAQNPEMFETYTISNSKEDEYDMLIVTAENLVATVEPLKEMYLKKGIVAKIASMTDIYANNEGRDNPEKLRTYIKSEYENHSIEYVVLGGDVQQVPYRGLYCQAQSSSLYEDYNIPADIYFSGLDGDWDSNENNVFGEYIAASSLEEADLYPELSVARLTFSSPAEFAKMMNKTEKYQFYPVLGEFQNPLFAGEDLWSDPQTWGADYLDLLVGFRDDNGYETNGIPENFTIDTLYDRDLGYWSYWDLMDEINTGHSYVHHSGHSNTTYAMRMSNGDITNSNFNSVDGETHNYTFVYSHGCICGAFDANDCIGEKMIGIDNFAVALTMNSRYGWFNEGQTEGPSAHIHREYVNAIYDLNENNIATAHKISKTATAPWVTAPGQHEEGALRWCFYDCNVLGDAGLSIWSYEPVVPDGGIVEIEQTSTTYDFYVSTDNQDLEGATCVMLAETDEGLEIRAEAISDADGVAHFDFDGALQNMNCEIWVSGKNIVPVKYEVDVLSNIENSDLIDIAIYPIPAKQKLFVDFDSRYSGTVNLVDISGRIVKSFVLKSENKLSINVADLANGIYFLKSNNISKKVLISE